MSAVPDQLIGMAPRLRKLRTMSAAELSHRLLYKLAIARERRAHAAGRLAPPDRLRPALAADLRVKDWQHRLLASRVASASRFLPSIGARTEMRALFETRYRAERDDMRAQAAETRAHRFSFFGDSFAYGPDVPWQEDPVTRRAWPFRYHADVRVHVGDVGCGDVKHVWELSRQQYLIDLGRSVFLDDDRESLASLRHLVLSWMTGNPYATGVHWSCALEPAFRSFAWLWAYALTWDRLDESFHLQWLNGFHDAGRFLEAHLELYSSPYNHLIGEAAALYMLGATFPEFAAASRWRARGRAILEQRLGQQFYADGGTVEQSTFYHHATVGDYLLAVLTAHRIGEDFSPAVLQAIERGLEFSTTMMQPDGRTPEIGGADDGKPIRMEHLPFWDFRPYQAVGAVLFSRADFKAAAGRFHEDALWLLGPEGLAAFERLPSAPATQLSAALPDSGYYVLRSAPAADADYVCFDCGEQAAGMRPDAIPNSMHGHADCLSVVVALRGQRVLVDSGFHAYNCGGPWETHFRETAAHNTGRVDGTDQARHLGKMAWSHSYRARPEGFWTEGPEAWAVGAHDGYDRSDSSGVTHRRGVWLRGGYVIICDEFVGQGAHDVEVNFQFAAGEALHPAGADAVAFGTVALLRWTSAAAWAQTMHYGGAGPDEGWIAPSLGVRVPAPRLSLRARMETPRLVLLSALVPGGDRIPRLALDRDDDSGGLIIATDDFTDLVTASLAPEGRRDGEPLVLVRRRSAAGVEDVQLPAPVTRLFQVASPHRT